VACLPVGRAYVIHIGKAACVQVLPSGDAPDVSPARYLELDEPDPAWWVETTWRPDRESKERKLRTLCRLSAVSSMALPSLR
jgi:hypothetical protein